MPTTTHKTIRQKIAKKLYSPNYPITSTTTSAGSTTTLNDTILAPASQTENFTGSWIYITEAGAGNTPNIGEIARVTNVDFTSTTSQLILAPALTDAIDSGLDYEIHRKFHPYRVTEKINEILENLKHYVLIPLTILTDGDMESSGITAWDGSGSTITPTKVATTVLRGRQALNMGFSTAAVDIIYSDNLFVPGGTELFFSAVLYLGNVSSDVSISVLDATSGDTLSSVMRAEVIGWQTLEDIFTLPETTEAIKIKIVNNVTVSRTDIIESVTLLPTKRKVFDFPSVLEWPEDMDKIVYFPKGEQITKSSATTAVSLPYRIGENTTQPWGPFKVLDNTYGTTSGATGSYKIELKTNKNISEALYVIGRVDYTTFTVGGATSDAETTNAPEDIVVDLVYADLLDEWAQEDREEGRLDEAVAKEKKSEMVRMKLAPRMRQFHKDRGIVQGTLRHNEGL